MESSEERIRQEYASGRKKGQKLTLKPSLAYDYAENIACKKAQKAASKAAAASVQTEIFRGRLQCRYLLSLGAQLEWYKSMHVWVKDALTCADHDENIKHIREDRHNLAIMQAEKTDIVFDDMIDTNFKFRPPHLVGEKFSIRVASNTHDAFKGLAASSGIDCYLFIQVYMAKILLDREGCPPAACVIIHEFVNYYDRWLTAQYKRLHDIWQQQTLLG
jgi:hypothetical protein